MLLRPEFFSEELGQLNDNWCPSSLRHQAIGNHVIDHLTT